MNDQELIHYGVPGMKWGVRRKTDEPTNDDVTKLAKLTAAEGRSHADMVDAQRKSDSVATNPKYKTKQAKRYWQNKANEDLHFAQMRYLADFGRTEKYVQKLSKKYDSMELKGLTETKTGERYARATLTDKLGNTYVSEIYMGVREDSDQKSKK